MHRRVLFAVSALSLSGALAGCPSATPDPDPQPITLTTYNAGLAVGFVPGAVERTPGTAAAIGALDADVICLQEVWAADQVAAVEAAATNHPHRYWPAPQPEVLPDPACVGTDLDPLLDCMANSCSGLCADDLPECLLSSCAFQFLGLEKDCMRCAQASVGGTVEEIGDSCRTEATQYAYGGSFGTGLLSAWPLVSTEELVLGSTTNRRSVLHAVVDAPDGPLDVFCTHLTAVFSVVPYPREEGSWSEEQAQQVADIRAWMDTQATTGRVALLGDLNAGPLVAANDPEQPENYDAISAGLEVPYVDQDRRCTFCPDNAISSVDSDAFGVLIDHVLLDGFAGTTSATRVLDDVITIESCGLAIPGAYSDHYGVSVTITP